jgi:NADPH:quinone reductase
MRALICRAFGPIESLRVEDVPLPPVAAGEVSIEVKASSLNFPDALLVQGLYQVKPPLPFSPGLELAGIVREDAPPFRKGDKVIAWPGRGGFAEVCSAPVKQVTPLPEGMDFETGSALVLTYCTSLHALQDCGHLKSGETLVVLGAAGGTGTAAIEIGKALGARVIAAASSAEKLDFCKSLGADAAIDYSAGDLQKRILELTSGKGADVVYDPVGGAYTEPATRALAWRGRLLVIGFAAGAIPALKLNHLLLKERIVAGVYWGDWAQRDPDGQRRNVEQLASWFKAGRIKPAITERVPLDEAGAAMQRIAARKVKGKIVVVP